jgi:hypothetical protein
MASHVQCIYRRPDECKERHKSLTEKSSGDGADSADNSGSSQHYPSTLPGVPKVCLILSFAVFCTSVCIWLCLKKLLPGVFKHCLDRICCLASC